MAKGPEARRVLESDLKMVVTAARYGRLSVNDRGIVTEKVPKLGGHVAKFRREVPTRAALELNLLTLAADGQSYEPTDAGRVRFNLH